MRILRFLSTGAIGLSVNLGTFHLLLISGLHYLPASMGAFSLSTVIGFVLQKYWTFAEHTLSRAPRQFFLYLLLAGTNLTINTGMVYLLVHYAGIYPLIAQTIGAGLVAIVSYLVYRSYIFKSSEERTSDSEQYGKPF